MKAAIIATLAVAAMAYTPDTTTAWSELPKPTTTPSGWVEIKPTTTPSGWVDVKPTTTGWVTYTTKAADTWAPVKVSETWAPVKVSETWAPIVTSKAAETWAPVTSVPVKPATTTPMTPVSTYKGAADKQVIGMGAIALAAVAAML